MNSLGWSRRVETPATTASSPFLSKLQSLNPFGNSGYVRLPVSNSDLPPQPPAEDGGWLACECPCQFQVPFPRISGFGSTRDGVARLECMERRMHMDIKPVKANPDYINLEFLADYRLALACSESLGSNARIRSLQHRCLSMLRYLLHAFPSSFTQA